VKPVVAVLGWILWVALGYGSPLCAAPSTVAIELIADVELPEGLNSPSDVRWLTDNVVLVADRVAGVTEVSLESEPRRLRTIFQSSTARDGEGVWLPSKLALSDRYVAVASELFQISWRGRTDLGGALALRRFEAPIDLDIWQDRMLILGLRRSTKGELAPSGAIVWMGSTTDGLVQLKMIHHSVTGAGAVALDHCFPVQVGAVRFLPDGSFLVVPGVEPGVFLYGSDGRLRQSWDSDALRIYSRCDLSSEQIVRLSARIEGRIAWLNHRVVVDDVVSVGGEPALLIRRHESGETTWHLKILQQDGGAKVLTLPVTTSVRGARVRADMRDRKLLLLVTDFFLARDQMPAAPPRLVILEIRDAK
jgi:hypothetical protein